VTLTAHVPSGASGTVAFSSDAGVTIARTASKGVASLTVRIDQTRTFTATYSGDDTFDTATSGSIRIVATLTVTLATTAHKHAFKVGAEPKFLITVRPARTTLVTVELQFHVNRRWIGVQQKPFTTTSSGVTLIYVVKRTIAGQYRLRARTGGGASQALSSWVRFSLVR
jgi:hypothetical protein